MFPARFLAFPDSLKPHVAAAVSEALARPVIFVCDTDHRAEGYAEALQHAVDIPKRALQLRSTVARSREMMFNA